jgi:hypothetical protein
MRARCVKWEYLRTIGEVMFGMALIFFGMSRNFLLSLLCMLFCGFGMMQQMAASNTIIQTIVDEDKRGRVMSFIPWRLWAWHRLGVCWREPWRTRLAHRGR